MTNMRISKVTAAMLLLLVAVACGKEEGKYSRHPGDMVVFSASGSDQPVTRTIYASGTAMGVINWQEGDIIEISSDKAKTPGGASTASYSVTPSPENATNAIVANVAANGLAWGSGDHTFWAVYPSPSMDGAEGYSIDASGRVSLVIPDTQAPADRSDATESGVTTTTLIPNMLYAPLISSTTVTNPGTSGDAVQLRFRAAFTAIEFVVKVADGELRLTDFTLSSAESMIAAASASATITGTGSDVTLTSPEMTGGSNVVTVPLGTAENPFILSNGNSLVFTVLALPFEDIRKVTVRFNTTTGYRQLALKYSAAFFAANKADLIAEGKADEDGWMIFAKGEKTSLAGFNVPGYLYLAFNNITIGVSPYQQENYDVSWNLVPYDVDYERVDIDGQTVVTQGPDSGWSTQTL